MAATFDYAIGDVAPAAGNVITLGLLAVGQLITLIVLVAAVVWGMKQFKGR